MLRNAFQSKQMLLIEQVVVIKAEQTHFDGMSISENRMC